MVESLALNSAGQPVDILTWKKAVTLWALGKATIVAEYEDQVIHSPRFSMRIPSVIQCRDARLSPRNYTRQLPLNRRNIFERDGGRCVYCGQKVSLSSFTIDHVVPRSLGGRTCWENVVAACMACNNRKGNKRWKAGELAMSHAPYAPKLSKAAPKNLVNKLTCKVPPASWWDYIYWKVSFHSQ